MSTTTYSKLVKVTSDLIRVKGFNGTAINEILTKVGVPKGSLYHHFPKGKNQLFQAALWKTAEDQAHIYKEVLKGKGAATNGMMALVDWFIETAEKSNFHHTCPVSAVCLDLSDEQGELQTACAEIFSFWIEAITRFLEYKQIPQAGEKAERFMVQLEGALLFTRVYKSTKHLNLLKNDVPNLLSY